MKFLSDYGPFLIVALILALMAWNLERGGEKQSKCESLGGMILAHKCVDVKELDWRNVQ